MPDTVEALHVDLDGPPEEAGVDAGMGQEGSLTHNSTSQGRFKWKYLV